MRGHFGRILMILSVLATLALVWVGVAGYRMGTSREAVAEHLTASLVVILALFFGHSWNSLYLATLGSGLAALDPSGTEAWSWRRHRGTTAVVASAVILLLALFLLGPAVMLEMLPTWVHGVAFFAALVLQILALILEARAVRRLEGQLRSLHVTLPKV